MTRAEPSSPLTIGHLAATAGVGVETVRYYQDRGLLPIPPRGGAFRRYPLEYVDRIRFIKRAQGLGFALAEISDLLALAEGTDRASIRRIASDRLAQIEHKLRDLRRMQRTLRHLVGECAHSETTAPCPIIATLSS